MTQNILLVARREFRQVLALKSFWLTLLILPAALALGPVLGRYLGDADAVHAVVVDRSGTGVGKALEARFAEEDDRDVLQALSRYVQRHELERADPAAPWAQHDRWYTPADIAAFRQGGGLDGARTKIARVRQGDTPEFDAPAPEYIFDAPPPALASASGKAFGDIAQALFRSKDETRPEIVVLIGKDYPGDPRIALYSANQPRGRFVATMQDVLTGDLRTRLLAREGVVGEAARSVQSATPLIAVTTPAPGGGAKESMQVRSIVPLVLAYILMMSLIVSASWMLQGAVEERSNKLLESLLACIRPEELMYGKLLGALAVGLLMIGVWVGCALVATFFTQGAIADMIRPALAPVSSPGAVMTIIYFFLTGYIAISILFVAIGAMVDSMSEAQGYMMPVLFAILLPITFLLQAVLVGKEGFLVNALTWFPLWTPFAVLARLGLGLTTWEVLGTAVLMAVTIAVEFMLVGRLFRASLLATGQKPGLKIILERLRPSAEKL
ncbi:MAG: ABC transporter permease [Erythrobacter sp.]|jgi:ABC-type Na+ efflux pump permease subunit